MRVLRQDQIVFIFRHYFLSIIVLTCGIMSADAQAIASKGKTRNTSGDIIRFSHAWTWEYTNEFENEGAWNRSGKMTIFVDTLSGTFLFNKEGFGGDADFVLATSNGIFKTGYVDEHGVKCLKIDTLESVSLVHDALEGYTEAFNKGTKPTGKSKKFGSKANGGLVITGMEYRTTFEGSDLVIYDYLLKTRLNLLPIYYYNQRQANDKLPYHFSGALHENYLLLETSYESEGKKIHILMTDSAPKEYIINLAEYKE